MAGEEVAAGDKEFSVHEDRAFEGKIRQLMAIHKALGETTRHLKAIRRAAEGAIRDFAQFICVPSCLLANILDGSISTSSYTPARQI